MRVIAGKARRLPLKTIEGLDTRPTTDRIKETLFNMIQNDMPGCHFLDLFSGSGAIAIEALSRGAAHAWFVEQSSKACACIKDNLKTTKLAEDAQVMQMDVFAALRTLESQKLKMDYIFMDPPYHKGLEKEVLTMLAKMSIADEDTVIITEADLNTDFSYVTGLGYEVLREKIYKTNKHIFLKKYES